MIEHNCPIPMYQQLSILLEGLIKTGEYKDGDKLPSESQLCKEHDVSRVTVRQALAILEQKDLVYSVHGKGTFVKLPSISQGLLKLTSFEKTLQQKGLIGHTTITKFIEEVPPHKIANIFSSERNEETVSLCLLGYANNIPVVYYKSFFPKSIGIDIHSLALEKISQKKAFSTFDLLGGIGFSSMDIQQSLTAVNGSKEICSILKMPIGTAFLTMETFVYSDDEKLVEYKIAFYRADKYSFTIKRQLD